MTTLSLQLSDIKSNLPDAGELKLSVRVDVGNPNHHIWNNNGTWFVHYTICEPGLSGVRRRHSLGTGDVGEARKLRDRLFAELEAQLECIL